MKKYLAIIAAGGALVAYSGPAHAQEGTFTGPRVEALVGYDISKAGSTSDNDVNDQDDESIDGLMYGVGIGYDVDLGGAVVGIEGEYSDSTAKTEYSDGSDFEGFGLGRVDTGRDLYVGLRAGAHVGSDALLYVKGGYTNARYNLLATDGESELEQNIDADGWRAGAGIEYAIGNNTFAKFEYRYSKYSEAEFDNGDLPDSDRFDIDTDRHQIVGSVGMRF